MTKNTPTVVILAITSDIGQYLAAEYLKLGYRVIGTYRLRKSAQQLSIPSSQLIQCDISNLKDINKLSAFLKKQNLCWDVLISCVGLPNPLGPFLSSDMKQWKSSVEVNSIHQLAALHALYPLRRKSSIVDVAFFAGGGSNSAVVDFSAYTVSKIMLTKMCELIHAENKDINAFIVGPGWTQTKIHETILKDPKISPEKKKQTKAFLASGKGTPFKDIFDLIQWLRQEGKAVAGGRNFSVVYDPWKKDKRKALLKKLKQDPDMYKLRRHQNNFLQQS